MKSHTKIWLFIILDDVTILDMFKYFVPYFQKCKMKDFFEEINKSI